MHDAKSYRKTQFLIICTVTAKVWHLVNVIHSFVQHSLEIVTTIIWDSQTCRMIQHAHLHAEYFSIAWMDFRNWYVCIMAIIFHQPTCHSIHSPARHPIIDHTQKQGNWSWSGDVHIPGALYHMSLYYALKACVTARRHIIWHHLFHVFMSCTHGWLLYGWYASVGGTH